MRYPHNLSARRLLVLAVTALLAGTMPAARAAEPGKRPAIAMPAPIVDGEQPIHQVWATTLQAPVTHLWIPDGKLNLPFVYAMDRLNNLYAISNKTGLPVWQTNVGQPMVGDLAITENGLYLVTGPQIVGLDPIGGAVYWRANLPFSPTAGPSVIEDGADFNPAASADADPKPAGAAKKDADKKAARPVPHMFDSVAAGKDYVLASRRAFDRGAAERFQSYQPRLYLPEPENGDINLFAVKPPAVTDNSATRANPTPGKSKRGDNLFVLLPAANNTIQALAIEVGSAQVEGDAYSGDKGAGVIPRIFAHSLWSVSTKDTPVGGVALSGSHFYYADRGGAVRGINFRPDMENGDAADSGRVREPIGIDKTQLPPVHGPVLVPPFVLQTSLDGSLYAFNADNMERAWRRPLGGKLQAPPQILSYRDANGDVIATLALAKAEHGALHALYIDSVFAADIDGTRGAPIWAWPGALAAIARITDRGAAPERRDLLLTIDDDRGRISARYLSGYRPGENERARGDTSNDNTAWRVPLAAPVNVHAASVDSNIAVVARGGTVYALGLRP